MSHQINNVVKATPATPPTTPPIIAPVLVCPLPEVLPDAELEGLLVEGVIEGDNGVVPPVILFVPVIGGVVPDPGDVRTIE